MDMRAIFPLNRLDGAGHVPQRVGLRSAGARPSPAAQMTPPIRSGSSRTLRWEGRAPAGDRLELVERATGVPKPTTTKMGDRCTDGATSGARTGNLVPHPPVEVLVDGGSREVREVEPLPGVDHGGGPRRGARRLESPRRTAMTGRRTCSRRPRRARRHRGARRSLVPRRPAVALGADDVDGVMVGAGVTAAARGRVGASNAPGASRRA